MQTIHCIIKQVLVIVFIVAAACLVKPDLFTFAEDIILVAQVLLAVHLVEYILVAKKLSAKSVPFVKAFSHTLLFGVLFWQPILAAKENK